jgi:hypothetical protein
VEHAENTKDLHPGAVLDLLLVVPKTPSMRARL